MRLLLSLIVLLIGQTLYAQSIEDKRYERAVFEQRTNGLAVLRSEYASTTAAFGDKEFLQLKNDLFVKEGIYKVEISENQWNVIVYHWAEINPEELKIFFDPYNDKMLLLNVDKHTF